MAMSNIHVVHQRRGKPEQRALLLCHFFFKFLALMIYLFSGLWGLGYITTFVIVVMLLSIDFWLVKNLSGRLLAGLRWWSVTDDLGQMHWRFEGWTPEERQIAYKSQVHLFWMGIIAQQTIWTILLLSALFGLKLAWMVIGSIAFSLNGANVFGYIRCRLNQRNQEAGFLSRIRDSVVRLFKPSGYMKGEPIYTG
ncbi:uncharacterized Golgi apparatus membrane protein-like protein CG5021 isoform X2 [Tigriopus californicus]|nr:uncharacterized Golgi apparatus membrane protein-like protein CG5021 isoform X2 [Tigriopus californicus]